MDGPALRSACGATSAAGGRRDAAASPGRSAANGGARNPPGDTDKTWGTSDGVGAHPATEASPAAEAGDSGSGAVSDLDPDADGPTLVVSEPCTPKAQIRQVK